MKNYITLLLVFVCAKSSSQTFYVDAVMNTPINSNYNSTYQLNTNSCDSIKLLYTCLPTEANPMNGDYEYVDMAIDTSENIYYISEENRLYTRKLNDTTSCQFLGVFDNDSSSINSLVCDVSGNVFAAGMNNVNHTAKLLEYLPKTRTFINVGLLPSGFFSSGDLFFYEGRLFLTVGSGGLVEITLSNPSQSCYYMDLGTKVQPYAAFSIQNSTCSDAYVIFTGDSTSTVYKINLYAKTVSTPLCTYPFKINGAASVYKFSPSIIDSNICTNVDSCISFPVNLLNFTFSIINNAIQLKWQTATEINSDYFLIEKSIDGVTFTTIGKHAAADSSISGKEYSFIDNDPASVNYYRLKEVDLDGKVTYSNVLLVKLPQEQQVIIIGNPVRNNLHVQINTPQLETNYLSIFDFSGRRLKTFTTQNGLQNIDVSFLPAGTYVLQMITSDGQIFSNHFIKAL